MSWGPITYLQEQQAYEMRIRLDDQARFLSTRDVKRCLVQAGACRGG